MRATFKKYKAILEIELKNAISHRMELLVYFLADLATPLVMMVTWVAIFETRSQVGNYTLETILNYYLLVFILRTFLSVYPNELSQRIRTGEINSFLVKPISIHFHQILGEVAWKTGRILYISIAILILTHFMFQQNWISINFVNPFFLPALIISFLLNYAIKAAIEELSFWISEIDGLRFSFYFLESLFAGVLLPIDLLPDFLQKIASFLPFYLFYSFPARILTGELSTNQVLVGYLNGILWLILSFLLVKNLFKLGLRQYSAYSG